MYQSFAECASSDYQSAVVVLHCAGEDFGCRCGILVDYHDHSSVEECAVAFGCECLCRYVFSRSADDGYVASEKFGGKLECRAEISPAVVGEVYYKVFHSLLAQFFHGIGDFFCRVFGKAGHAYVACGGIGHETFVDAVDGYVVADNVEFDQFWFSASAHSQTHERAFGSAQHFDYVGVFEFSAGYDGVVGADYSVAGEDSAAFGGAACGGLYHVDGVFKHIELYAYAAEFAFERLCEFECFLRSGVG